MRPYKRLPSLDAVRYMFRYDPKTGSFWNFNTGNRAEIPSGYNSVMIRWKNHRYTAARIAWLMVHGADPGERTKVAYCDGNPFNLAIDNLYLSPVERKQSKQPAVDRYSYAEDFGDFDYD